MPPTSVFLKAWMLRKVLQDFWTCLQAIACWTVSTSLFLQFIFWRRRPCVCATRCRAGGNKKEFNVGKLYEILALGSPRQNPLPLLSFYCYEIQGCAKCPMREHKHSSKDHLAIFIIYDDHIWSNMIITSSVLKLIWTSICGTLRS